MNPRPIEDELRAIVAVRRSDAALDALALLADAYGLRSAALWELRSGRLVRCAGFGDGDERALPRELWGPDLERTLAEASVSIARAASEWSHGDEPHVLVPILVGSTVRGVVIARTDGLEPPDLLRAHCQVLAPLLQPQAEALQRAADALEQGAGEGLWAALLTVQEETDGAARLAADAIRTALAELRAATAILRDALPRADGLADAIVRYGAFFGLTVYRDVQLSDEQLSLEDRVALVGIVREAFENAAVHGRARVMYVSARLDRSAIRLVIEDDGKGVPDAPGQSIDPARLRGGLGLAAIHGHAASRSGGVALARSTRGGLRIEVDLHQG